MRVLGASIRTRGRGLERTQATLLARRVLEEVMEKRYADPDSDAGETRATFDDVDDYNGWVDAPPTEVDGSTIAGYTGWSVSVTVAYADATDPAQAGNSGSGLKRITVTAKTRNGIIATLTGLRAEHGMADRQLLAQRAYVGRSSVKVRVGTVKASEVTVSVNPLNQAP